MFILPDADACWQWRWRLKETSLTKRHNLRNSWKSVRLLSQLVRFYPTKHPLNSQSSDVFAHCCNWFLSGKQSRVFRCFFSLDLFLNRYVDAPNSFQFKHSLTAFLWQCLLCLSILIFPPCGCVSHVTIAAWCRACYSQWDEPCYVQIKERECAKHKRLQPPIWF